jgi:N6-L-threonylcarbamoyladenine synthase
MFTLAIDTSCDDTSVAILQDNKVLSNIIASQEAMHSKWGGIVPGLAKKLHHEQIDKVIIAAFSRASNLYKMPITKDMIDVVAVTYGPGLAIALEVGIAKAIELATNFNAKLIAVNHMEGHLLSSLIANSKGKSSLNINDIKFPFLGLLISGGHTQIILATGFGEYTVVADTLDDAIGEAYDKVARMLGLGYPGGKVLTEFAKMGNSQNFELPIPLKGDARLAFSYSGLKTAVYYKVKKINETGTQLSKQQIYDIAATFEQSAIKHLQDKLSKAIKIYEPKMMLVGGGVGASPKVRAGLRNIAKMHNIGIYFPNNKKYYIDNAAMIGLVGYLKALRGKYYTKEKLDRDPRAVIGADVE